MEFVGFGGFVEGIGVDFWDFGSKVFIFGVFGFGNLKCRDSCGIYFIEVVIR